MGDNLVVFWFWFWLVVEVVEVVVMVEPLETNMRRERIVVVVGKYRLLLVQVD